MQLRKPDLFAARLALAVGLVFAAAGPAQAREGTFSGTFAGFGTYKTARVGKDRLLLTYDENDLLVGKGLLDHATFHCLGLGEFVGRVGRIRGYCVFTDPAGDQFVADFETDKHALDRKTFKGSYILTGGTGKFAGITGTGTYVSDGNKFRPTEEGTFFAHGTDRYDYKLP